MPALLMTAAEIAAAEAAAAQILAAQQAAAVAEAAATAQAAQVAQAAQAAQTAQAAQAATTATQAATQASTSGIQALAQEVGANTATTGIQTLTPASELEQMRQMASGAQNLAQQPVNFLNNSFAGPIEPIANAANFPGSATNPLSSIPTETIPASTATPLTELPASAAPATPAAPVSTAPAAPTPASTIPPRPDNALYQFQGPTTPEGLQTGARLDSALQPSGDPFYNINSGHIDQTFGKPGFGVNDVAVEPSAYSSNLPAQPATGIQGLLDKGIAYAKDNPIQVGLGAMSLYNMLNRPEPYKKPKYKSTFDAGTYRGYDPTPPDPYRPQYAGGGPVEAMSNANAIGANTGYPMADIRKGAYATPYQQPISRNVLSDATDAGVNPMTGEMLNFARGGISDLGGYSDYARGGRMLKGPGDGMSDDIPATIANKQPARLANEEFVVPADVVSHLGNGSSEAGAKALYKMMDRVRQARTGNKKQGKQINPEKFLA